jgi:nitroimidazol reductase NimA-like FMN-containing flavoprotein (pyridoxamine 5'-phosphate oxidase superfamily)
MKVFQASSDIPGMTKEEVDRFLGNKLNLQLATVDTRGWPNIHPVWFYYDKNNETFLLTTSKLAKKTENLRARPTVYFSIDEEISAPKGVKGRGIASIIEDPRKTLSEGDRISMKYLGRLDHPVDRISMKYLGRLDHPVAKMVSDGIKKGDVVLIEISPKFLSTWDYGKTPSV